MNHYRFWCLRCCPSRPFTDSTRAQRHVAALHATSFRETVRTIQYRADGAQLTVTFSATTSLLCAAKIPISTDVEAELFDLIGITAAYNQDFQLFHLHQRDETAALCGERETMAVLSRSSVSLRASSLCALCADAATAGRRGCWRSVTHAEALRLERDRRDEELRWYGLALVEELTSATRHCYRVVITPLRGGARLTLIPARPETIGVIVEEPVAREVCAGRGWRRDQDVLWCEQTDAAGWTTEQACAEVRALLRSA